MTDTTPILMWFRRDLRLHDHIALNEACATGRPVIPVFLNDEVLAGQGAAPRFRLGLSVEAFAQSLKAKGSRLILRQGKALDCLTALIAETGATAVYWSRLYDPVSRARDEPLKAALKTAGIEARSFPGHVLFEPWTVATKTGGFYRVFTPMWKAVCNSDIEAPLPEPGKIPAPDNWPASDALENWHLARRHAPGRTHRRPIRPRRRNGSPRPARRLHRHRHRRLPRGPRPARHARHLRPVRKPHLRRDQPPPVLARGPPGDGHGQTGGRNLRQGTGLARIRLPPRPPHPPYRREQLAPRMGRLPVADRRKRPEVTAWKQGRTGLPFVDAAMREMYVTGTMHNRGRMIVASYLTKHLMTHWKIGLDWFADCLTDWDPCSNAMGWQWSAGSGPDATPYFRIFNPESQLEKFDPKGVYARTWIAEGQRNPPATALSYFDAVPQHWGLTPGTPYPRPIVSPADGRDRALRAYGERGF
jgi:deoxyribodipyrimidine photo-lyase